MPAFPPAPTLPRLFKVGVTGVLLSLSACLQSAELEDTNRYASLTLRATGSGEGPFRATPTLTFFASVEQNLPDSRTAADNCGIFNYSPEIVFPGDLPGGDAVPLRIGDRVVGTLTEPSGVPNVFALPNGGSFEFQPGDTLVMRTPGVSNGFPAGEVAVRLAEPINLGPLVPAEPGLDYSVSWDSEGDDNSGVIVALRYAAGPASDRTDRQLLCIVRDNGAFTVSSGLMGEFVGSSQQFRELSVLRWRTNRTVLDARTDLYVVSTLDTIVSLQGTN